MPNLIKKIKNSIFQQKLIRKNDKIILAVSGGPDSVCLLDIFSKLQKKYSLELIIAHVNYGLRAYDSELDEKFVRELADKYNFPVYVLHPKNKQNVSENYLRDIRYNFFEKLRIRKKFNSIAVAHTLDDQAETLLLHLIRGAGLQGLSAMLHKTGSIIRPFLEISKQEILKYLEEGKIKYRIDKTNKTDKFLRNKIRNQLIPYLSKNFNPAITRTLSDNAVSISADYDLIAKLTQEKYVNLKPLKISQLLRLHPSFQRNILRQIILEHRKDLKDISNSHIEEILKVLKSTKGKNPMVSFKGLKITKIGDKLEIKSSIKQ